MKWKYPRGEERLSPKPLDPVYVEIMGTGFYDRCKVKDISKGGISFYISHDFEGCDIDHELDLVINLPNKQSFKVLGKIRHKGLSSTHYFGVHFTYVDERGATMLTEYLKTLV